MLEQLISFFETAPLDEVTKLLKKYDIEFRKDEVIEEDKPMKKIKIKKWEDLLGLESKDEWGNITDIMDVNLCYIAIRTHRNKYNSKSRSIYVDTIEDIQGGRERVLEELKMCGFDVEFIEKPELTSKQKLELEYFKEVYNMSWIARDTNEILWTYVNQPVKKLHNWNCDGNCERPNINYDFISWEDDEPWSIEELLEN